MNNSKNSPLFAYPLTDSSNSQFITPFMDADPLRVDKWGAKGGQLVEDFKYLRQVVPQMPNSLAIPDGFILSTEVWRLYRDAGNRFGEPTLAHIKCALAALEKRENRRFAGCDGKMPLVLAVRGGAPVSLPGALGTVLNVGLNDEIVSAMIKGGEDEAFVLTTYLSAIRIYGEVVLSVPYEKFYSILQRYKVGAEGSIPVSILPRLIEEFKRTLQKADHPYFPPGFEINPERQLQYSIEAVMRSWTELPSQEARNSRTPPIPDEIGTAVIVQTMVFGNRNASDCLSGVLFTRNQRTGEDIPIVEWAPKVQCDKIVSGKLRKELLQAHHLQERFPEIYQVLMIVKDRGENRAGLPLDIEFTVENRRVYVLQRRPLRMTCNATVRAMWDLVDSGKTSIQRASMIINNALNQQEKSLRDGFEDYSLLARGEAVTNCADGGILTLGSPAALELARQGVKVVLVRKGPYGETEMAINNPLIRAVIRTDGNTTGHEAVCAVAYGKPYLINVTDPEGKSLLVGQGEDVFLNPESLIASYLGKEVFVDGCRGIVGATEARDFLEDRRTSRLYIDYGYLQEQFERQGLRQLDYDQLLDIHCNWEIELEGYRKLGNKIIGGHLDLSADEMLTVFARYLSYLPEKDLERTLNLKGVDVKDFDLGPPLQYNGKDLGNEVLKILRPFLLCITWRTHWVHEIMTELASRRGDFESDVIRDIQIKKRTMSIVDGFKREGFHVIETEDRCYLILASNFEFTDGSVAGDIGSNSLSFEDKGKLARQFLAYLQTVNPSMAPEVEMMYGKPPLGEGHTRIISVGLSVPQKHFAQFCRIFRSFLDNSALRSPTHIIKEIPVNEFIPLAEFDPYFSRYPDLRVSRQQVGTTAREDTHVLAFGDCSFGEFDGVVHGKDDYDRLTTDVLRFQQYLEANGHVISIRPWQFEIDPYRRHSLIAAVGIRFEAEQFLDLVDALRGFLTCFR